MPTTHITFAKLAASPTPTSWSLSYNAGNLFAAFSLSREHETEESLSAQGKQITNILQSEFFTLEQKTLQTIEQAIRKSLESVPEGVLLSGCIAFLKDSIVYLYAFGNGQALLNRNGTSAALFSEAKELTTVSGYLQSGDILLLATSSFMTTVPQELLTEGFSLQLPSDMAELLTPTLHKQNDGTSAATIITFASSESPAVRPAPADEEDLPEEKKQLPEKQEHEIHPSLHPSEEKDSEETLESDEERVVPVVQVEPELSHEAEHDNLSPLPTLEQEEEGETLGDRIVEPESNERTMVEEKVVTKKKIALPHLSFNFPKKNLFFISIAIALVAVLVISIVTTKQSQLNTKDHAAFVDLYDQASKTYAEGEGLLSLNKTLAMDDFKAAKETLDQAKQFVKAGSEDEKKYNELLEKINAQGVVKEQTTKIDIAEADKDAAPALEKEISEKAIAVTEDSSYVYTLTSKAVTQIDKGNDKEEELFTNDEDWSNPQAISVYLSNIYILDKGETIHKFVAGSSGYGKSSYFKESVPSLKNTISMSIDSSVYLLDSDGTIRKFTKGVADSFAVTGLPNNFSSPKKLYTSATTDNLYVLDNGNKRVVKLDKQGTYITSYNADKISSATDFVVSEKDKKVYLLIDKKVYQLPL